MIDTCRLDRLDSVDSSRGHIRKVDNRELNVLQFWLVKDHNLLHDPWMFLLRKTMEKGVALGA
jgi:hypothetical protein